MRKHLLLILGVLFLAGCASGPELEKYPRREIDRPYTVPKGVATWHLPTIIGYARTDSTSAFIPGVPVPVIWESAISDDWNLIWYPIPLGFSHQFSKTETNRIGMTVLTGFSYGSYSGFRLQPNLIFSYRQKLSKDTAIEVSPSVFLDIPFQTTGVFWTAGVNTGPLYQLSDTFALKPAVSFAVSNGTSSQRGLFANSGLVRDTSFMMGMNLSAVWSFARQWDLRPSYSYEGIGAQNGYQSHLGIIEFVHFW